MKQRKKRRRLRWRWVDPIYQIEYWLMVGDRAVFERWAARRFKMERDERPAYAITHHLFDDDGGGQPIVLFWFSERNTSSGVIAHEALHGAWGVLRTYGVTCDDNANEALAFYLTYLVDCIESCLCGVTRRPQRQHRAR